MTIILKYAVLIVFAYFIGSIPSAYIAGKLKKGVDIRKEGTGNVGATNTILVAGPLIGAIVYIFDVLKGLVPVLIARELIGTELSMGLVGLAAILGHDFSFLLAFKGGKGVATTIGTITVLNPLTALLLLATWVSVVVVSR